MAKTVTTFKIMAATAASLMLACAGHDAAVAARSGSTDYFGRSTVPAAKTLQGNVGANVQIPSPTQNSFIPQTSGCTLQQPINEQTTPPQWFKYMDMVVGTHLPSPVDRFILDRQLDQNIEHVMDWSRTAAKIGRQYHELAKMLRAMPVPPSINGSGNAEAGQLRSFLADWYEDSASIFDEFVKPRPAARTKEELHRQLDVLLQRSIALKSSMNDLKSMESRLRAKYNVGPPAYDDALMTYVKAPLAK